MFRRRKAVELDANSYYEKMAKKTLLKFGQKVVNFNNFENYALKIIRKSLNHEKVYAVNFPFHLDYIQALVINEVINSLIVTKRYPLLIIGYLKDIESIFNEFRLGSSVLGYLRPLTRILPSNRLIVSVGGRVFKRYPDLPKICHCISFSTFLGLKNEDFSNYSTILTFFNHSLSKSRREAIGKILELSDSKSKIFFLENLSYIDLSFLINHLIPVIGWDQQSISELTSKSNRINSVTDRLLESYSNPVRYRKIYFFENASDEVKTELEELQKLFLEQNLIQQRWNYLLSSRKIKLRKKGRLPSLEPLEYFQIYTSCMHFLWDNFVPMKYLDTAMQFSFSFRSSIPDIIRTIGDKYDNFETLLPHSEVILSDANELLLKTYNLFKSRIPIKARAFQDICQEALAKVKNTYIVCPTKIIKNAVDYYFLENPFLSYEIEKVPIETVYYRNSWSIRDLKSNTFIFSLLAVNKLYFVNEIPSQNLYHIHYPFEIPYLRYSLLRNKEENNRLFSHDIREEILEYLKNKNLNKPKNSQIKILEEPLRIERDWSKEIGTIGTKLDLEIVKSGIEKDIIDVNSTFNLDLDEITSRVKLKKYIKDRHFQSINRSQITFEDGETIAVSNNSYLPILEVFSGRIDYRKIEDIEIGQIIVMIDKDLDNPLSTKLIESLDNIPRMKVHSILAKSWYLALRNLRDSSGYNEIMILDLLQNKGSNITTVETIRDWMRGKRIGPLDPDDVLRIGELSKQQFLIENYQRISSTITYIRGLHSSFMKYFRKFILTKYSFEYRRDIGSNSNEITEKFEDFLYSMDLDIKEFEKLIEIKKIVHIT